MPEKKKLDSGTIGCLVILAGLGIIGLIALVSGPGTPNQGQGQSAPAAAEKPLVVSATMLLAAYHANEVSADEKYKGRLLKVTGVVESINKDILDSPFVSLIGGEENIFDTVQVTFNEGYKDWLMKLRKVQRITAVGRCKGMLVGSVLVEAQ